MKTYFIGLILLILVAGCADNILTGRKNIDASDYGLTEGKDATIPIFEALQACKDRNAKKLIIPEGIYHFYPDKAFEKYVAVSNNDNSKKRIAFPIIGFDDFEIDFQGSELIFHGMVMPFEIEKSSNIKLRNFSIDWEKPFYGQAEVIDVDPLDTSFVVRIDGEFAYEIHHDRLWFKTSRGFHNIQKNLWFDPVTRRPVYNVNKYKLDPWNKWVEDSYEAKELDSGIVRVKSSNPNLPEPGWIWVCKGGEGSRLIPAMHMFNSFSIDLENMNLYHSGGMGIIAERSGDISMNNIRITTSPGKNRVVSTTADATHFVNCKGHISFNNCLFENMLDDATNVHGIYTQIVDIVNENTLGVVRKHIQQEGFQFATDGDTVRFVDNETLLPLAEAVVTGVREMNESYMEITLDQPLTDSIKVGYGVENLTWNASMTMKNCKVQQNRARSILISTPKKVLVENNTFSSMMAAISVNTDVNFWFESGPVNDLTIRKNTFINNATGGKGNTVLMVAPNIQDIAGLDGYYHKNIVIEDNLIKTFDNGIIYALSVDSLSIKNNIIEKTTDFEPIFPEKPTIQIKACRNVIIENNVYKGTGQATIEVDQRSNSSTTERNNKGFEEDVRIHYNEKQDYDVL